MNKQKFTRGANITLGLLGVLLAGIEIGKSAVGGNTETALMLSTSAIAALASGNIELFIAPFLRRKKTQDSPPSEPESHG